MGILHRGFCVLLEVVKMQQLLSNMMVTVQHSEVRAQSLRSHTIHMGKKSREIRAVDVRFRASGLVIKLQARTYFR